MHLGTDTFVGFVNFICDEFMLNDDEINTTLSHLDGLNGVLAEKTFILGYEAIARYIGSKSSYERVCNFIQHNTVVLSQDADARYFFVKELIETLKLSMEHRALLISIVPATYQVFLKRQYAT